jgi:hypothetical protein
MEIIISSAVTGGLALAGVVFTGIQSNKKIAYQLDKQQAITDTKLEALTEEVKKHNNFAQRLPVVEEQIKNIDHRLNEIERKIE